MAGNALPSGSPILPGFTREQGTGMKGPELMTTAKRSVILTTWALVMLALLLPARLRADEAAAKASQPHVVLIGISDYADKQIKPRAKAETDTKALYDLFTNK